MSVLDPSAGEGRRALIADDDPGIRLTLCALVEQKGYLALAAENGREAIEAFANHEIGLVLLDINMPEADGFEACSSIRKLPGGSDVPILMLTGQDDTESIRTAYEVGATDFVSKPINYVLLGFRIDYIMRTANIAEELRKAQQRSNNAQIIANLGHVEWDTECNITHFSKGIREILVLDQGTSFAGLDDFVEYVHPDDRKRVAASIRKTLSEGAALGLEHRIVRSDGSIRFVMQISERREAETSQRVIITMQDITDRIDTENRLHNLVYYDMLTGLPNRNFLIQHLDQHVTASQRYGRSVAVIALGVDRLDKIVKGLEHDAVETLLKKVANRIKGTCRRSDLLSRKAAGNSSDGAMPGQTTAAKLKNDLYIILLPDVPNIQAVSTFMKRVMEKFEKPFALDDRDIYISVSGGISLSPIDATSANELVKFAEIAQGFAGRDRVGSFRYFKQDLNDQVTRNFTLSHDLRGALARKELEVYYQPKQRLDDQRIVGVEALCRWRHPELGGISPLEFIDIAEEENLIGQLGEWVLKTACEQVYEWNTRLAHPLSVSINISPRQFGDRQRMDRVIQFIADCPLDNALVELELTESTLFANFEASLAIMRRMSALGCGLAIDDFGTGYSSLSYLGEMPAKVLKIDKSFIELVDSSKQYKHIVRGIINLAHSLEMEVVAEGVEYEGQKRILEGESCDQIQGFFISRPLPAGNFERWLLNREADDGFPRLGDLAAAATTP